MDHRRNPGRTLLAFTFVLAAFGCSRAPPRRAGEVAAPAGVKYTDIEQYFEQARPMQGATKDLLARLHEQKRKQGLQFSERVDCRGSVCRSVLAVPNEREAQRLKQMEVAPDVEIMHRSEIIDFKDVVVTVYSTVPGVRFADLLRARL